MDENNHDSNIPDRKKGNFEKKNEKWHVEKNPLKCNKKNLNLHIFVIDKR